jgi:hypothetical protein
MPQDACATVSIAEACAATLAPGQQLCLQDTFIPWNRFFFCSYKAVQHSVLLRSSLPLLVVLVTLTVLWLGVGLLSKVRRRSGHWRDQTLAQQLTIDEVALHCVYSLAQLSCCADCADVLCASAVGSVCQVARAIAHGSSSLCGPCQWSPRSRVHEPHDQGRCANLTSAGM